MSVENEENYNPDVPDDSHVPLYPTWGRAKEFYGLDC
jgi:hypothetical protein